MYNKLVYNVKCDIVIREKRDVYPLETFEGTWNDKINFITKWMWKKTTILLRFISQSNYVNAGSNLIND